MEIVADVSTFLAVVLNEIDRDWIIDITIGQSIISPEVLPYEIGNALIMVKRKGRLDNREIIQAFELSQRIAVRLVSVNIRDAVKIALRFNVHAYDAYYLQCCLENKSPLISLDHRMCDMAKSLEIKVLNKL